MIRRLALAVVMFGTPVWSVAQTNPTQILDTIVAAGGGNPSGTAVIQWNRFLNDANPRAVVFPGSKVITITAGVVNTTLFPNSVALPVGSCYKISYTLNSVNSVRYWSVPVSSTPVTLNQIESGFPCTPTQGSIIAPAQINPGPPGFSTVLTSSPSGLVSWTVGGAGGSPGGTTGQVQYNNGGVFGGFTIGGDCSLTLPNLICTKTNGVTFAPSATTDTTNAANISSGTLSAARVAAINLASSGNGGVTGNLPVGNLNGGAMASATTFWNGTGGWLGIPAANLAFSGTGGVAGNLPVGNLNGGSGASATTYWRGDGTWASVANGGTVTHNGGALLPGQLVLGNNGGDIAVMGTLGTSTSVLHGNAGGNPSFSSVVLTTDVSGILPYLNGGTGTNSNFSNHQFFGNNSGIPAAPVAVQPTFADLAVGTVGAVATFPGGDFLCGGVNIQTGTSYTIAASDSCELTTYNNASAVAVTLPHATTSGFTTGAHFYEFNRGAGAVTITPTVSTINGGTNIVLNQNQGAFIMSDGLNYSAWISAAPTGSGTVTNISTTGPLGGGPITTTGTITCSTCVTSASSLTSNQIVIGSGSQGSQTLGTLGTTTTVLHGNSGGGPSFGQIVNADITNGTIDLGTKVTGSLPFSSLGNPTGNLSLVMGSNTSLLTYGSATGSPDLFTFTDAGGNTGTGHLVRTTTQAGSAAAPFEADVNGTGWQVTSCAGTAGCGGLQSVNSAPLTGPVWDNNGAVINVKSYGAKGDGTTDDTTAIQNAINGCPTAGGQIFFPAGKYKITSGLTYGNGNSGAVSTIFGCAFVGAGGSGEVDNQGGPGGGAVVIYWYGAAAGTMFTINGPMGGVRVENLHFDANGAGSNEANTCLAVHHAWSSSFRNLQCRYQAAAGFTVDAYQGGTTALEGANEDVWENIGDYSPLTGSIGMQVGMTGATGISPFLDVAKSTFINLDLYAYSVGLQISFVDNCVFMNTHANAANGVGLKITAPAFNNGFPGAVWFYYGEFGESGTPISASAGFAPGNPIYLWPYASGPDIGNVPGIYGITTYGGMFPHFNTAQTPNYNNDIVGTIALSSATSASYTYTVPYGTAPPVCELTPTSDPGSGVRYWATATTSALTAHVSSSATVTFNFVCLGHPN